MPNRHNNPESPERRSRHIVNTDSENTQYIPTGNHEPSRVQRSSAGQYSDNPAPRNTPGRQQYYGTEQPYPNGQYQPYPPNGQYQQPAPDGQYRQYPPNGRYRQPAPDGQYRQYPPNGQYQQPAPDGQYRQYPPNGQYQQPAPDGQYRQYPPNGRYQQPAPDGQYRQPSPAQERYPENDDFFAGSRQPRRSGNAPRPQQKRPENRQPKRQQPAPEPERKKKKKRKKGLLFKLLMTLLIILAVIFIIYSCIALFLIKKINYVEDGSRNRTPGALSKSYVTSILLVGTDGRTNDESARSDTTILLSINSKTKKITLTSFMRDSCVSINGYGEDKLTHAYSYGGPELLMDTIEQNFNIQIDDYIAVNFNSFASIIDAVGGIDIDVSDSEAQEINTILMAEVNELLGDAQDDDLLSGGGRLHLNGKQALSYARIRYIGNADFERTERQRQVLTKVAEKIKSFKPSMITDAAKNALPHITTDMTTSQLYFLSLKLPFVLGYDIEQIQIPAEGTYGSITTASGGAALSVDFNANYQILEEQVFGE